MKNINLQPKKKWSVIDCESNGNYSHENPIKFLTNSIKLSLCDYSGAYILITGYMAVKNANNANLTAAARICFKNCAPVESCRTEINLPMKEVLLIFQSYMQFN